MHAAARVSSDGLSSPSSSNRTLRTTCLQQIRDALFGIARGSRQSKLGYVVRVQARDVVLLGRGNRFLRLHDFYGIRDAGAEPVPRLDQGALSQIAIAVRHRDLLVRGGQTQKGGPNFDVDAAADVF